MSAQPETQPLSISAKRPAEEEIQSFDPRTSKESKDETPAEEEEDVFTRLENLEYRTFRILKFPSEFLKCLLKNMKTLQGYQCSEYRGEYQDTAFQFHKHKLEPYLLSKCIDEISFKSNDDMEEKIKQLEHSSRITENHSPAKLTIYRPHTGEDVFMIKYKRAIHSEYYDEDMEGGQAEYDSDGCCEWRDGDTDSDEESDSDE